MSTPNIIYNLNCFDIKKYLNPITDDVSDNITNNTTPKIVSKTYTSNNKSNNTTYKVLKYQKSALTVEEYSTYGMCRSIIVRDDRIMCFSPPKSVAYDQFTEHFDSTVSYAEDFIDGTMINLFYDEKACTWEIATRSTVGGNTNFFMNDPNNKDDRKTFRDMFFEACKTNQLMFEDLCKDYCYCFVLQHPSNRIVTPVDFPKLFLIRAYSINNTEYIVTEISNEELYSVNNVFQESHVVLPNKHLIDNYENLANYYNNAETPFQFVGIMIYSGASRSKIRNTNYENIRDLRGNQSKLQYHYLVLRQRNKVREFLLFYPEFSEHFSQFRSSMHEYTNNLHKNYVACFIKKQQELKKYPYEYKVHMFNLHQKYLGELKERGEFIDRNFVINYFNRLEPPQQMHILNCRYKLTAKDAKEPGKTSDV